MYQGRMSDFPAHDSIPHRFRQVPTFGRGTIRKFGGSVSAMKKLAGRDWEDILQVGATPLSLSTSVADGFNFFHISAGFRSSRVSYQKNRTISYSTSPLIWPHGTPTQNFGCTQLTQSSPYGLRQKNSAVNSAAMPTRCVPSTRRNHCQERLPPPIAGRLQRARRPVPRT